MSQAVAPAKTNKLVIRIKVPSDIEPPVNDTLDSNKKSSVPLGTIVTILIAIGLAFWLWNSQQNESTTDKINSTLQVSPASSVASPEQVAPADTVEINKLTNAKNLSTALTPTNAESAITTEITKIEEIPATVTKNAEFAKDTRLETPLKPVVKNTPSPIKSENNTIALQEARKSEKTSTPKSIIDSKPTAITVSENVARAVFAHEIKDREPINQIEGHIQAKTEGLKRVYFFSELRNMKGSKITHRWIYDGKQQAEISFQINGDRWRVYSSKRIVPAKTGEWQVDIVESESDNIIATRTFNYGSLQ